MRPLHVRHSITGKTYVAWDYVWRLETEGFELIPTVFQSQRLLRISQYLGGGSGHTNDKIQPHSHTYAHTYSYGTPSFLG